MASALMDNLIAAKLLYMLVTPFNKTEAFKLGIIDAHGKVLVHAKDLKTNEQKDAYNYLTRLIFNIKRLINKLPGGESNLKNLTAAYYFVKERFEKKSAYVNESQFMSLVQRLEQVTLVEEELFVERFLSKLAEDGGGGGGGGGGAAGVAANNASGGGVAGLTPATGAPVIKKKDIKQYKTKNKGSIMIGRRPAPVEVK